MAGKQAMLNVSRLQYFTDKGQQGFGILAAISAVMALLSLIVMSFCGTASAQVASHTMTNFDRDRAQAMLQDVANDVRKHYYDPNLHGVDWNAKVQEAKDKIAKETTLNMAFAHIAAALDSLNDSHTFFVPPPRPYHTEFGWHLQIIGDRCLIVRTRPQSDADAKGIRPGDELLSLNGFHPVRDTIWKMEYAFGILRPQPGFHLRVRTPSGDERTADVATIFRASPHLTNLTDPNNWQRFELDWEDQEHLLAPRFAEPSPGIIVVKFDEFFLAEDQIENIVSRAQRSGSLVLDLRGNPGGAVETAKGLLGAMFDHEVKIGDRITRNGSKPLTVKAGLGHRHFDGKLVVLIDSKSSSASEIFARVIQLEQRGTVIGDRSSGLVMESLPYTHQMGTDVVTFYGASITEANILMKDGKSLEHAGVTPDEVVLPQATDLANGRDPVLARAIEFLGGKLSPDDAGKLFPYRWSQIQGH